jgi:hypothetical protein
MSELSDKAITEIQNAVRVELLYDKNGNEYSTKPIYRIKEPNKPEPPAVEMATLTGLVDFCGLYSGRSDPSDPAVVYILSPVIVELHSQPFGPNNQRTLFARVEFGNIIGEAFTFGKYYEQEEFIVGLATLFYPTPERAEVLKLIGTIKDNQVREYSDDGVSQSVSARAGVALVTEVPVPNPVFLRPYRTFREVEQPRSPFILRVKQGKGERPVVALFEADGGVWRLDAMNSIRGYLDGKIALTVIA